MAIITVSDRDYNENNLYYVSSAVNEILVGTGSEYSITRAGSRTVLKINAPDCYSETVCAEVADKLADVVAINYKFDFLKKNIPTGNLSEDEKDILLSGIIAADLDDDKKFAFDRIKGQTEIALDGVYNFRLRQLKRKWAEIISYVPTGFLGAQLKDFITFLLENKNKKIYVDDGKVYDAHYRRLKKSQLIGGGLPLLKEILLSNCGKIELSGKIPAEDEKYLKEFYGDRLYFSAGLN